MSGPSSAFLVAQDFARLRDLKGWNCEDHRNDAAFDTDSSKDRGGRNHTDRAQRIHPDLHRVEAGHGKMAQRSREQGCFETREDGTTKVRLLTDLRRSGGNGGVELPERVVLPRISDFTNSILDLMFCDSETVEVQQRKGVGHDLSYVDVEDVFHTLAIREQDRGVMAICTYEDSAVFRRLRCGMAAALLVWCRVSAAAARLGEACFLPNELRMQIFVDDQAIVTRGTQELRAWRTGSVVVLVRSRFHFQRAQGASWLLCVLDWCPSDFNEAKGKVVHAHRAYARQGQGHAGQRRQTVQGQGHGRRQTGAALCRQVSWASGLFPCLKNFNIMLCGAITPHVTEQYY